MVRLSTRLIVRISVWLAQRVSRPESPRWLIRVIYDSLVALTAFSYKVRVVVQNLSSDLGDEKMIEALVINSCLGCGGP